MVTVQTRFYGTIRPRVRKERAEFTLPDGATFRDLIRAWVEQNGVNFARMLLTDDGELRGNARMTFEGKELRGQELDSPIVSADSSGEVHVFVLASAAGG